MYGLYCFSKVTLQAISSAQTHKRTNAHTCAHDFAAAMAGGRELKMTSRTAVADVLPARTKGIKT